MNRNSDRDGSTPVPSKSSRLKVQKHRERLRAQGLRPIQIWVPDVDSPSFRAAARRQSKAVASSPGAKADQAFIDSVSSFWTPGETTPKLKVLIHKAKAPDTGYWAEVPGMPGCVTEGETLAGLRKNLQEASRGWLRAQTPPTSKRHTATFKARTPNAETARAIRAGQRGKVSRASNITQMMAELNAKN